MALAWAAKQRPRSLAAKMVLLGLANFADEHGCAYPSTAALADFGDMDHKTATVALDRLITLRLIADTGDRAGRTKQIKIYKLALQSFPETEASRKRKPPVFEPKAPQKRGTDTVREPQASTEATPPTKPRAASAGAFPCPADVDPAHWRDLLANRKSKRLTNTPTAHKQLLRDLAKFTDDEWPPGRIVEFAAARGWGAIFDPRNREQRNEQRNGQGKRGGAGAEHPIFAARRDLGFDRGDVESGESAGRDHPRRLC